MTRARTPRRVYQLFDFDGGVEAVVRYSGDPDEFTALAHAWLADQRRYEGDAPVAVLPPEPRLYRMNPYQGDEYGWTLGEPTERGRGVWLGALLRTVQVGCPECQRVGGGHRADCLNDGIVGLVTCQFTADHRNGPLSQWWIHAVRVRGAVPGVRLSGTPGPTLCGFERFGDNAPGGWSLGGGSIMVHAVDRYRGCYQCGKVATREFPGLTISGSLALAEAFTSSTGVPLAGHLVEQKMARLTNYRTAVPACTGEVDHG